MGKFEYPVIKISEFAMEIVIASSNTNPTSETANEAAWNWLKEKSVAKANTILMFNK